VGTRREKTDIGWKERKEGACYEEGNYNNLKAGSRKKSIVKSIDRERFRKCNEVNLLYCQSLVFYYNIKTKKDSTMSEFILYIYI
jgi:hypothetical protein